MPNTTTTLSRKTLRRLAARRRLALRPRRWGGPGFALSGVVSVIAALLAGAPAHANPTGGQVMAGQASIVPGTGDTLDIHQSTHKAIIHWQRFDVAPGQRVNFLQPGRSSVTLNRVLGNDPSAIFGQITAPGTVMLVNPNGVVFGAGSRIDVGSLVATTANIRDEDFLAGRYVFSQASAIRDAAVINEGTISLRDNGLAALVAPHVRNSGVIEARLGRVALGGAGRFTLDFHGDGLLSFAAGDETAGALVEHTGRIQADGGTVLMTAQAVKGVVDQVINTQGIVSATTVGEHQGRIVLSGSDAGTVAIGGQLAAGGEHGGSVVATGRHITVGADASIDVSGRSGGGEIALGSLGVASGFAGKSATVEVAAGARLAADATVRGDGGQVTMWSTDRTVFAGSLQARGGAQGGDGGFAEVSSLKAIGLQGQADLRAEHGRTGTLLIDPTDLRIVAGSGGSQDGAAGDGTVAAGDANQGSGNALNTVSASLLGSLAGNSNIVLQATGQITVDTSLNLQTTAGHGFTLQSTQTGGIRFSDAQHEIRTQGGNITLQAQGVGSTLSNIGKLSSQGGSITLDASGDIQLAGAINAGSGAVKLQSAAGSIANAAGVAPLLTGGSVNLSALAGQVGSAGSAIATHTTQLALATGGSLHAGSDTALATLTVQAQHATPASDNTYQVSAPGLVLQMADGAAGVTLSQLQQAGLDASVTTDRSLQLGTVSLGGGDLTLASTRGDLLAATGGHLTAATLTLSAAGSSGNNGAIGGSGAPLLTQTGQITATAGSGGVQIANTGAVTLQRLSASGSSSVSADGTVTLGSLELGSSALSLSATAGNLVDDGVASTGVAAGALQLQAAGAIGGASTPLSLNVSSLSANGGVGGIHADITATSANLVSIVSGNGAIDIAGTGSLVATSVVSSTSAAANSIRLAAAGNGTLSLGTIDAGTQADVTASTDNGSITRLGSGVVTGARVSLTTGTTGYAGVTAGTAAQTLAVTTGSGGISIAQTGDALLENLSTTGYNASVTAATGQLTVGRVQTNLNGSVSLTATGGAIVDDGNSSTRIDTGSLTLTAGGHIGSGSHAMQTRASNLTLSSVGDLYVANADRTLDTLAITHRHASPGSSNTLQVSSPYLTFDISDNGSRYAVDRLAVPGASTLRFSGDNTLRLGQVYAPQATVTLTSTQGSIFDDGLTGTRVSGNQITLSAAGHLGAAAQPVDVSTSVLTLTTAGDLFLRSVKDLSNLTITSTHADPAVHHGFGITAPSLRFEVTDGAAGLAVNTLTDLTGLSLSLSSDRSITLGSIDVGYGSVASLTSTTGSLLDDGDKSTVVLANSTNLKAAQAIGASGSGHLDVMTSSLGANAGNGGIYITVPMPTGSSNYGSSVTLAGVGATALQAVGGPVDIRVMQGDLSVGSGVTAATGGITLQAAQGSIVGSWGTLDGGSTGIQLLAQNTIGTDSTRVRVAGGPVTASAGTGIGLQAPSGNVIVGNLSLSGAGAIAVTADSGSILDDGDAATRLTADRVTLTASNGAVGATGAAIGLATAAASVTARGDLQLDNTQAFSSLALTRSNGASGSLGITASGQTFTLSEDGSAHHLQAVDSTSALAFSFTGVRDLRVGAIDTGAAGSITLAGSGHIFSDGSAGAGLRAGTVSLTAGSGGSIGSSTASMQLDGSTTLSLSAGRDIYATSNATLGSLSITSSNATNTASVFGVSAAGQTFSITDSGSTQTLDITGTPLAAFTFRNAKNIQVSEIVATGGQVTLATSGGGANANISSLSPSGRINAAAVDLSATSSTAGGGNIGSAGSALALNTGAVKVAGSADIVLDNSGSLGSLDMTVTHGRDASFSYSVSASNINSFSLTDGNTQSLGLAVSGAMDFSFSTDRGLSLSTVDAGTSTTGSIALTSRSAPSGTAPAINRSSGSLTAGSISLTATGTNGNVGGGSTLSTNTKRLAIASGGDVSVSNSTTLDALSVEALHRTSGVSTHSYSISSTGLTFSLSDSTGTAGLQLNNVTQSGLDLRIKSDRTMTAGTVNTGAGGKVSLVTSSSVRGAGANAITTGDLYLEASSVLGASGGTPLYTAASTLSSKVAGSMTLSNTGTLVLAGNVVGSTADITSTSGSLLQGSGATLTAAQLKLTATQGSIGAVGNSLQTDTTRLTLNAGRDIQVANAGDLYALDITANHVTAGTQGFYDLQAARLTFSLTDSAGGDRHHLAMTDTSGLNFSFKGDVSLDVGVIEAQAGRSLTLQTTGSNSGIFNDGSSLLSAGSIALTATGQIGASGSASTRLQTRTPSLTLSSPSDVQVDNALDLSRLSLTSTATGTPNFHVTAPSLTFDVTDNGTTTRINEVSDATGLDFTLSTTHSQSIGIVDTGASGLVSLTSTQGDLHGDADASKRITAAQISLRTGNGGDAGSVSNPLHLSAPVLSFNITGALNAESDTHVDALTIQSTHVGGIYGGAYSLESVAATGGSPASLFNGMDDASGTYLGTVADTDGLAFSFTGDRLLKLGSLYLGTTGSLSLTAAPGIVDDGDTFTRLQAASATLTSSSGVVGSSGAGNGIDAVVGSLGVTANNGVNLALHGGTRLTGITSGGAITLTNDSGDIALGSINANGQAIVIDNQGGSILSGYLQNTGSVSLTASGSIGNESAIGLYAQGSGTTTLVASAAAAHGADGSIAIDEGQGTLVASSVTGPGAITLSSRYNLSAGTITAGGAVNLSTHQGSIVGINGSNLVTGSSVDLTARYGSGNGIGSSGTRLRVDTTQLALNTPGSVYITGLADLGSLSIDRTTYNGSTSAGTLSLIASNLSFSATDSGNVSTLTSLSDSSGLAFSYAAIGSIAVGNLSVGASGQVTLATSLSAGSIDAINGSSLISAGSATLTADGATGGVGSASQTLGLAVDSLVARAGDGGLHFTQAGSLRLDSLSTTGDLSVTATSGNLTLGNLSYGAGQALNLAATAGSLLAGGGVLSGGSSASTITLSAANGIGTELAPLLVNASAGMAVDASVTGTGSLWLSSLGTMNGGLTTAVHNGATHVLAAGAIKLTSMTSGTDAEGNDIRVTAKAGDITVGTVSGGSQARHTTIDIAANAGRILTTGTPVLEANEVRLHGATGVGSVGQRVQASGERVQITSDGGALYLQASSPSSLSYVGSNGGRIDIAASADLLVANAASGGGVISIDAGGHKLYAGNIDAGTGSVTIVAAGNGGSLRDDGKLDTRITGQTVTLTADAGVGTSSQALQTQAATLVVDSGTGVYLDDQRTAGTTLQQVRARDGAVSITTAGPTVASQVSADTDGAGNDIRLTTSAGALTLGTLSAGATHGQVQLSSAGDILAAGNGIQVSAHSATLQAGGDIGTVTDTATGAGSPVRLQVAALDALGTTGQGRVVSVDNAGTGALVLGSGALSLGAGTSAYLKTAGDLDVSAGITLANGNLSLDSGGVLTLSANPLVTTGSVRLVGATDVVATGATPRSLQVEAQALTLRSGAAGGDTRLVTRVDRVDASLAGSGSLTVDNTGTLASATLATTQGDIDATSSAGLVATSVVAGGSGRTVRLTATSGDLSAGLIDAGTGGSVSLSAAQGALSGDNASIRASQLQLSSASGIGSSTAAFNTTADRVSAEVTGSGDIHLASAGSLTLDRLVTQGGDIAVQATGTLTAATLQPGAGGTLTLQAQDIRVGDVSSTGAQRYVGRLNTSGALTAASVTVEGDATLGGNVTTTGAQHYAGAINLTQATTLTGQGVAIDGALEGAGLDLTVQAGAGDAVFGATIGQAARLGQLSLQSAGDTRLAGSVRATSVSTDAAGSLRLSGGSVDTTGTQVYGERMVLGADAVLAGSSVTLAGGADAAADGQQSLVVSGPVVIGGAVGAGQRLGSLSLGSATLAGGALRTTGAQTYAGALTLAADTTVSAGGDVRFDGRIDGAKALQIDTAGLTRLGGVVNIGALTTDAAGSLLIDTATVTTTGRQAWGEQLQLGRDSTLSGQAVVLAGGVQAAERTLTLAGTVQFGGAIAAGSLVVDGAATLVADTVVTAGAVDFRGSVGGAHALTVDSSGATRFGGAVSIASLSTDAPGTLVIDAASITTSGRQQYGELARFGTDSRLAGSQVVLSAGAASSHALAIDGAADIGAALAADMLTVSGPARIGGEVNTRGDQAWGGDVTIAQGGLLRSSAGALRLAGTLDATNALDLTLEAAGAISVAGAVGNSATPGALTLRAGGAVDFGAALAADSLAVTAADAVHFAGPVTLQGTGGLQATGGTIRFDGAVSATLGMVQLALTDAGGSLRLGGDVTAATGLLQTGGARVELPGRITVAQGPIRFEAPATLPAGQATIQTNGDITFAGLMGPSTALTMAAGSGRLSVGTAGGDAQHQLAVQSLTVPTAASAALYGSLGNRGGSLAAAFVRSPLLGDPWFMNDTPWGPLDTVNTIVATTIPNVPVPSTPGATPLFTRLATAAGITPNVLTAFTAPTVLTIAPSVVFTPAPNAVPTGSPDALETKTSEEAR